MLCKRTCKRLSGTSGVFEIKVKKLVSVKKLIRNNFFTIQPSELSHYLKHPVHHSTKQKSHTCRQKKSQRCPFQAVGFFFYGKMCSGAGPVHKAENEHTYSSFYGPSLFHENPVHRGKIAGTPREEPAVYAIIIIGTNNFISRHSRNKCQQNSAIQSKKLCKRI